MMRDSIDLPNDYRATAHQLARALVESSIALEGLENMGVRDYGEAVRGAAYVTIGAYRRDEPSPSDSGEVRRVGTFLDAAKQRWEELRETAKVR